MNLRFYQSRDVEALRSAYRSGKRAPLYVLPTGGGKTIVFVHIAQNASARGKRIAILVHRQELLLQASRKLLELRVPHGVIAPGHTPTRDLVQVASVQTLARRLESQTMPYDLLIIDEAHHATAGSWRKIIAANPGALLLGVTATPERTDGQGLGVSAGGVFDSLVTGPPIPELIADGHLSPPVVYAPPIKVDLSGIRMQAGDFARNQLAERMDKPTITGDAVSHYRRICPGAPALAFCASVAHAAHVAAEFRAAGFRAASIDGKMLDFERSRLIEALGTGKIDVLTSCEIVSEGTDIPVVAAAILLRPTASTGLYLQQVGRALRPADGKSRAYIIDHVGNCLRHGLPDDEREWTLDGKRRGARGQDDDGPPVAVRQCPKCYAAHRPADTCPHCGYVYQPQLIAPEQVEGELQEITPEQAAALRVKRRHEMGRARTLEDLKALAKERGYSPAWAEHVWKARQKKAEALGAQYGR